MSSSDYRILAYAGPKHPRVTEGELILDCWQNGESAHEMELGIFHERMQRGSVGYILVYNNIKRTHYRVDANKKGDK